MKSERIEELKKSYKAEIIQEWMAITGQNSVNVCPKDRAEAAMILMADKFASLKVLIDILTLKVMKNDL